MRGATTYTPKMSVDKTAHAVSIIYLVHNIIIIIIVKL